MTDLIRIRLEPLGRSFEIERGSRLQDVLFSYGLEFPCGGRGRCRRCRVRLLEGALNPSPEEIAILGDDQIAAGWRLACRAIAAGPLTLEIAQWDTAILADDSAFEFTPEEGLGIAIDLGTTTLVAQMVDLQTGQVLGVRTALNPQAAHGSDVMTRVQFSVSEGQQAKLTGLIRDGIGTLISELSADRRMSGARVRKIAVVGNTVMHHLFCGIDVEPLAHVPFEPSRDGLERFLASEIGWAIPGDPSVAFLPCLGGFVGSDILAGILATKLHENDGLVGLIDLGTNGEIVFGSRGRMICASTAAGPAFEGGRISMGMRASTGAIAEVDVVDAGVRCHVLGNGTARGICGSGLVDAVCAGLRIGTVMASGRLANGKGPWEFCPPVSITQRDIRELQLAKGAIAAGIRIILNRLGCAETDVGKVYLAGAFGNYVNRESARRIGLLTFGDEQVEPSGNTALLGAKMALFAQDLDFAGIRSRTEHISLASDPQFQEIYVDEMGFPDDATWT